MLAIILIVGIGDLLFLLWGLRQVKRQNPIGGNHVKTALIIGLLLFGWFGAKNLVGSVPSRDQNSLLTLTGLLLAGSIAGHFAFSYGQATVRSVTSRRLGHVVTLALVAAIGLLLETALWSLHSITGRFPPLFYAIAVLLYISIMAYDYWDFLTPPSE